VEGNLDLQKIPKLVPILGKRACGERWNEKGDLKGGKNWVDMKYYSSLL
jgi:hypothetical protein